MRLKKKLAQVLLVLRASQAKVAAFEAIQQGAQIAQSAVEVQTEPISIVDPEARSSTASNATACAVRSAGIPLAQTAGNAELTGRMDSAAVRASLAMPAGGPPFLHVAPGAHVNITINHAPEPMTTAGAPTPPVGGGPVAQANKFFEAEEAESITATSPTGPEDGCNEGVASSLAPHCGASDYGVALVASPAAPAVIAIPTTTTTAVLGTVAASGTAFLPRTEVGPSEVSMGSCSAVGACPYGPGAGNLPSWPLQQTPVGPEAYDCVLGPAAMPKGPRHASAASSGQSICGKPPGPRNILVDATQRFEAVPVHEVRVDSREALTASPMIVPPSDEVVAAASRLLGWQAQHGCAADEGICAATAPSTIPRDPRSGRKVLSYDPAIGQSGAFYFIDVPDMAADPAGTMGVLVSGSAQAVRPGGGSVAGSQPVPSPPHDVTATAMPGTEHLVAVGPQLAPQALQPEGEATFRPWSDGHGASMSDRAGAPVSAAHQHHRNPHLHQHQLPVSERMAPASPCSSYTTETTNTCTPFLHGVTMPPQLPGSNDTPASSSMSLSRMALALDEMARRQRWDVQPPGGVGQPHEAAALGWAAHPSARGGHATQLAAPGAVVRHGMLGNGDFGTVGATGAAHRVPIPSNRLVHEVCICSVKYTMFLVQESARVMAAVSTLKALQASRYSC
ncbi:hypothetical protein Vretimale_13546 [Volvox reticuliferus]|uniref:Uncharacterized protein n=3 Tax=Volvox reticuliferus TaxID=1737510 RepID=A0A8J4LT14_9CHLO|nr:hypothetical protein Vretimale_13546 [Volvox reticuliferus]